MKVNHQAQNFMWDKLGMGVCYYPEHWDKSLWRADLLRMKEAGITTIRIAEFAWSKCEPEEGVFTFDFWDEFLQLTVETDMKVIFGTPTATPPRWLTYKYPECLNADKHGNRYRHGCRRHYNYNAPKYRELCARIVEQLAIHYGKHPQIVGWQIDNEINCETNDFYSESDEKAFQSFLQRRYGTLAALNEAWGTDFWNQGYTGWEEISFPVGTLHDGFNPHQKLDYIRFVSESAIGFVRMQSDILRRYVGPEVFITTNGMFGHLDNHRLEREALDVYTYDSYPNFAYCMGQKPKESKDLNDRSWSRHLSEVRSVCPHFGIMEQQSGANGWNNRMEAPSPKPGQMMLWAMQSVAYGADYVSFFRWRTSRIGTEIYWHGILDYDNRDNRKLKEIKEIGRRFDSCAGVTGAEFEAAFGVVRDYENEWDTECDVWHERVYWESEKEIFVAAELTHTPYDYVYLNEEDTEGLLHPEKYPVLFYPHASIIREENAALLEKYVEEGGTLILGCRTGYKEEHGQCVMTPMPGLFARMAGVNVRDFTFVGPGDDTVIMRWNGVRFETPVFNDILEAEEGTRILARYESNYYKGAPALTEHAFGKGRVITFGGVFTRQLVGELLKYTGVREPFAEFIDAPASCALTVRKKDGVRYLFVLNFSDKGQELTLLKPMSDLDDGKTKSGEVVLEPYGTRVYRLRC